MAVNPLLLGGIFEVGKSLIDKLIPDKEAKAKAHMDLLQMQQNGELKELETRMAAVLAEANSADPWTSRARPSFMYVFYFVILALTIVAPVIGVFNPDAMEQFFVNVGAGFKALPQELWWTFTAGYLGYAGARTIEKRSGVTK
jgi:hypothetical protein